MKTFELTGTKRDGRGKKAAKDYRKEGLVPCVLYGEGENISFNVKKEDLRKLIFTPEVYIVNLTIEGKNCKAIVKETQFHPVSDEVLHVDFYEITEDKLFSIEIPVELQGLAEGVKAGGKLNKQMRKLKVKGKYEDFPEKLVVNIDHLELGKVLKVGEIHFDNLEILNSKEAVVCSVKTTRVTTAAPASPAATPAAAAPAAAAPAAPAK